MCNQQMGNYPTNHGASGVGGVAYGASNLSASGHSRLASSSSVLRSINDILREDRDLLSRTRSSSAHRYEYGSSPTRRYLYGSHSRGASPSRNPYAPTEEERSMERLASTFRTEDYTSSLYERLHDFSPLASDQEIGIDYTAPTAMPLLPDMPSRSRKLLEDLAGDTHTHAHLPRGKYGASTSSRYLSPR